MSRVTIVTGASRGIGAATALLAASHGDAVCVNYAHDAAAAGDVVRRITDAGGTAIAICADVAHEADVVRLFAEVDGTLGPVGLLVNNAGVAGDHGPVERVTAGGLERVLAVNVDRSVPVRPRGRSADVDRERRPRRCDRQRLRRVPPSWAERASGSPTRRRRERSTP